jgi:hypothetical protein
VRSDIRRRRGAEVAPHAGRQSRWTAGSGLAARGGERTARTGRATEGVIATPLVADHGSGIRWLGEAAQFPRARQICAMDEDRRSPGRRQTSASARGFGSLRRRAETWSQRASPTTRRASGSSRPRRTLTGATRPLLVVHSVCVAGVPAGRCSGEGASARAACWDGRQPRSWLAVRAGVAADASPARPIVSRPRAGPHSFVVRSEYLLAVGRGARVGEDALAGAARWPTMVGCRNACGCGIGRA